MTWRAQVGATVIFGGGILLIGLGKLLVPGARETVAFLVSGASILFLGVVLRGWQRRAWAAALADPDPAPMRARLLSGPFGRVWTGWLHVSPDGRLRD